MTMITIRKKKDKREGDRVGVGVGGLNGLPVELREKILARLPISSVFNCRRVCKTWNKLLTSPSFLHLWGSSSTETATATATATGDRDRDRDRDRDLWFLVYHTCRTLAAFSPNKAKWNNLPLYDRCSLNSSQVLLASSAGLLCFRNRNSDEYPTLIVCNPVTSTYRLLPIMPQVRYIDIVGMISINSPSNSNFSSSYYQILVTGTSEPTTNESITEVFDSRTGQWEHHCSSQQDFLQFWYEVHAIWHEDGFFYCLATPLNTSQGYRLIAYDMSKKIWIDLNVKMPSPDLRCPSLLICRRNLYLTGKIVQDYLIKSICIWELQIVEDVRKWVLVEEMPDEVLKKIHSPHSVLIQCQGHGDLMCFSTHRGWQSIMFNLVHRTWHWLPENDVCTRNKSGRNNLVGLIYEPSLSAMV